MKICFVISGLSQGGAERVLSVLANYLSVRHEITILKFDENKPFYEILPDIEIISTHSGVGNKGFFGNLTKRFDKFLSIREFLKTHKFDVVISFLDAINVLTLLANSGLKNKIIISEHTNHTFLKSLVWRALKRITYPGAAGLSVLSKFDYDFYTFVKKRAILQNPMFETSYKDNFKKENLILAAGRLINFKGFDIFLKAVSKISPEILKSWKIIIAGDGEERKNLENLARELNVNVCFAGFVKNIDELYAKAKIVVVTSRAEGFCNILMESIFFNCARISTNCVAGPSDLINDGVDGFLCAVDDENEIAKKLEILIKDENLRDKFVLAANRRRENFSVDNISGKWIKFIKECIGESAN